MAESKLSYKEIEGLCNEMHAVASKMNEILSEVRATSRQVSNSWEGEASSRYVDKFGQLANNFDDVFMEIENSILYMAKVSDGYQAIDKTVKTEILGNLGLTRAGLGSSQIFPH